MAVRKIFIRFCNNIFCNEINKRGGWNFSKSVSVGPTFIREMRVKGWVGGMSKYLLFLTGVDGWSGKGQKHPYII